MYFGILSIRSRLDQFVNPPRQVFVHSQKYLEQAIKDMLEKHAIRP